VTPEQSLGVNQAANQRATIRATVAEAVSLRVLLCAPALWQDTAPVIHRCVGIEAFKNSRTSLQANHTRIKEFP
jgi:hypothetical protein